MKYILYLLILVSVISCSREIGGGRKTNPPISVKRDSIENLNRIYLTGFATCQCVYGVPENSSGRSLDISPSIFADIVNFWGIDTLSFLAKEEAKKIKPSEYKDYLNKKPIFIHCHEWANSPHIDSLIRKYAKSSAEEWLERERKNSGKESD